MLDYTAMGNKPTGRMTKVLAELSSHKANKGLSYAAQYALHLIAAGYTERTIGVGNRAHRGVVRVDDANGSGALLKGWAD
jgi:hypothetical protein